MGLEESLTTALEKRGATPLAAGAGPIGFEQRLQEAVAARERGESVQDPTTATLGQAEAFQAEQVGQASLGPPGLKDFGARFDIGLSDTFEEKKKKFIDKFPDGDLVEVKEAPGVSGQAVEVGRGGKSILFRKNETEPFAKIDAGMLEDFEPLGDFADISGELPALAAEILFTKGAGLVRQLFGVVAGTLTGDAAKESIEALRGFQLENFEQLTARETGRALTSAAGGAATVALTGPVNLARGAPAITIAKGAPKAQRAAKKLGISRLLPSQIAKNPLIRALGGQSSATVSTINNWIDGQRTSAVNALTRLRDNQLGQVLRGELATAHKAAREKIIKAAQLSKGKSLTEGGSALEQGVAKYDDLSKTLVDMAYAKARRIEEPQFTPAPLVGAAEEVKVTAQQIGPDAGGVAKLADDILNFNGQPKTIVLDSGREITVSPLDQLQSFRQRAFDLKTPAIGDRTRVQQREAAKLFGAVDRTIFNPENASGEFVTAWRSAGAEASARFETMEKLIIQEAGRTETPAQLAARLAKPEQVDNLRILKNTVSNENYKEFQESVFSDMLAPQNVDNITNRLNGFDEKTLDLLLSKDQQSSLRSVGEGLGKLKLAGIDDALAKQQTEAGIVQSLIQSNNQEGITQLVSVAAKDPSLQRRLRAGLMENIVNSVIKVKEGVKVIDNTSLRSTISSLREAGALKLLTKDDLRTLTRLDQVTEFLPVAGDTGTSLQRGATVAGLRQGSVDALITLIENIGTGRFMTSKLAQRILLGTGKKPPRFSPPSVRIIGATMAQMATEIKEDSQ